MSYNVKNYTEQGGEKTVIGGTLEIQAGASVTGITTATIVDALNSDDATKALSAKQGKALKTLVDGKYTAANATSATAGLVKQAAKVAAAAGDAPTKAEFDALIASLVTAGIMAAE
jgi:hypothetical protein